MYWETDPFVLENNHWILNICYFSTTDDALKVSIKMCKNPFEDAKKKYFQREEFAFPNNEEFKLGSTDREADKKVVGYPAHAIVAVLTSVSLAGKGVGEPRLLPLIC